MENKIDLGRSFYEILFFKIGILVIGEFYLLMIIKLYGDFLINLVFIFMNVYIVWDRLLSW